MIKISIFNGLDLLFILFLFIILNFCLSLSLDFSIIRLFLLVMI
jgi:hypothetical protein